MIEVKPNPNSDGYLIRSTFDGRELGILYEKDGLDELFEKIESLEDERTDLLRDMGHLEDEIDDLEREISELKNA